MRALQASVPRLYQVLLDLLAPRACAACPRAPGAGQLFCSDCATGLVPAPSSGELSGAVLIAPFAYAPPLSHALHALKYGGRADLATPLGALLRPHVGAAVRTWDALVPVPLHPLRLAERGYNQSALLARACAAGTSLRVLPRVLTRVRHTGRQVGRSRRERLDNALQAFRASGPKPRGMRVALVDDVVTTGATARACIEALRTVGADVCAVLCVARAEAPAK